MPTSVVKNLTLLVMLTIINFSTKADEIQQPPYLYILGVAQDAGYPQAGCYQPHCMRAWREPALKRLTTSFAVIDAERQESYLFEATPDIKQQLFRLHQETGADQHNLKGIFLTHAHIGHYTGLMHFGHEAMGTKNIPVYSLPRLNQYLADNGPWSQLISYKNIILKPMQEDVSISLNTRLKVEAFKVPHRDEYSETAGFKISGPNKSALFIPDIDKWQKWSHNLADQIKQVDIALIDGSFFANGELPGRDMSLIPHPLVMKTMELLATLDEKQRAKVYFIHFNHSNPLLDESSSQANLVREKGFNVATEGLKIEL